MNNIKKIIFALLILLIIISGINHYSITSSGTGICIIGDDTQPCVDVQNSKYGVFLGIKVSLVGFIAFIFLFLVYLLSNIKNRYKENFYEIYLVGVAIGTPIALYFIILQFFILKQICSNCMIIDGGMILVAILSFIEFKRS